MKNSVKKLLIGAIACAVLSIIGIIMYNCSQFIVLSAFIIVFGAAFALIFAGVAFIYWLY